MITPPLEENRAIPYSSLSVVTFRLTTGFSAPRKKIPLPGKPVTLNPLMVTFLSGTLTTGGPSSENDTSPTAQMPSVAVPPGDEQALPTGVAGGTIFAPRLNSVMPSFVIATFSA